MISQAAAMRELHWYAMEVMRSRGLEEAACEVEAGLQTRRHVSLIPQGIRSLKRDPSQHLTDWWREEPVSDFVPIGA